MLRLLLIVLMFAGVSQASLPLVADGKSDYLIVLASDASPAQRRGADELQSYLEKISGAKLPVVVAPAPLPEKAIVVGAPVPEGTANLGDEGYLLRTQGSRILIIGPGKRGAMYGCYALLEEIGVRWFTPEVTGIPESKTITLPDLDRVGIPSFEYREPFFTEAFDRDWAARNRCNGNHQHLDDSTGGKLVYHPFVHSFDGLIPVQLYKTHPEYFPLIKGERKNGYVQRCLSNPDVLQLAIKQVQQWIKNNPEAKILSVSQNDTYNFCECDACKKIVDQYGGVQSGIYLWFANQVAEAIEKDHPDKLIDTLAYQFTEAPPTGITPRANVRIRLCPIACCVGHTIEGCSAEPNRAFAQRLAAWSKLTDSLYIWHYNTNFANYLMPFPDFREFPEDLRLYHRSGVKGVFFEGAYAPGGGGAESELRAYVMAKMLWDISLKEDALIDEWMTGVYGPAAKPMRAWLDLIHQPLDAPSAHLFIYHGKNAPHLTPDVFAKGEMLFNEAEQLTKDNPLQSRYVAKEKLCFRYAKLLVSHNTGEELDALLKDARAAGITQMREGMTVDEWEAKFRAKH
jgi:hypothetical protein